MQVIWRPALEDVDPWVVTHPTPIQDFYSRQSISKGVFNKCQIGRAAEWALQGL